MPALRDGDHLGRYEILGPLGAGGMGEVYRAHDERLDRDVAITVLPEDVARDRQRLERFEREAKTTAALGHTDDAFRWLDKAVTVHDADLFMTLVWPAWDPIRNDPRFDDLLRRLNFPVD